MPAPVHPLVLGFARLVTPQFRRRQTFCGALRLPGGFEVWAVRKQKSSTPTDRSWPCRVADVNLREPSLPHPPFLSSRTSALAGKGLQA
ncbi:hypothetical protein IVB45_20540 [Bradyrhizobium sp. 4]|uniref:hypothetical protein n=1 Tax=unclassified Bradyrhizobium TaxID=2631580 RepID=UPI001FF7F990|nr:MULTISPECIES: hypothetical protein [unclassified Bradyrhizobium]MCK1396575.1 hypothetical protein [Bradyrhizobium sp. 39]MCK1748925.1 hypothetical protein [Bradyrhizobium sp. 135]UPJ32385.1 hypothetical protein IVB45_20540 [Bradyrhizobium sp. 4]